MKYLHLLAIALILMVFACGLKTAPKPPPEPETASGQEVPTLQKRAE